MSKFLVLKKRRDFLRAAKNITMVSKNVMIQAAPSLYSDIDDNKKAINYKTVGMGFILQISLAIFIFKVPLGQKMFLLIGEFIRKLRIFLLF